MAGDGQLFPPSELKIECLRRAGVIPFSQDLASAAFVLGLFIGLSLFWGSGTNDLVVLFQKYLASSELKPELLHKELRAGFGFLLGKLFAILSVAVFLFFIVGLYQTRLLIRAQLAAPDFSRLFDSSRVGALFSFGRYRSATVALFKGLLWGCVAFVCLREIMTAVVHELPLVFGRTSGVEALAPNTIATYTNGGTATLSTLVFSGLVFVVFVGVLSRIWAVLMYYREHQMTRAEYDAESREMDISPQIAQERRERLQQD